MQNFHVAADLFLQLTLSTVDHLNLKSLIFLGIFKVQYF